VTILPPAPAPSGKPWSPASWGLAARLIVGLALLLVLILLFTVGTYQLAVWERRQAMALARQPERPSRMTGEARFGAIVPVTTTGWAVAFTRPVGPLEAALRRQFLGRAGAIWGVTLLVGLLAAVLVSRMVRPLRVLVRAATAMARGERPTVAPVGDPPEAAALADAIRAMSAAVAQREDALRDALHLRDHLYRMTEAVTRAERVEEIYDRALEALLQGVGADRAALLLRDRDGVMRCVRSAGLSPAYCAAVEGHSPWAATTADPQPVLIPDVAVGLEPPLRETVLGEGIRAMAFFPLVAEGRLIGTFMVYYDTPHAFRNAEVQTAQAVAGHVAFAIRRHRAEEARRRMERTQRYLAEASRVLSESLDYERTLHEVARLAVPALADLCLVDLRGDDGVVRRVVAVHADPARARLMEVLRRYAPDPAREAGAGRVLRTRQPEVVQPVEEAWLARVAQDAVHLQVLRELGVAAQMTVPLLARDAVLGTILFAACDPRRRFDADDLALAEELGRRVALAIENARLYARERHIAETLQRSLLPDRLPEIPGLRVAARYLPAGPEAEIGGDWYDVLALPTGEVALVMGDVAGRGVRAAATMGQLRNAVRAYALEGHPPALIVERLNALLHADEMATCLYVTLDLASGRVRFVNAGHVPPLVVAPEGRVTALEGGALPLGILSHARYPEGEATLAPGALLLLFTDGLVEARGRSLDDGLAALRRAAAETAGVEEPAEVIDRLVAALLGREAPVDDVAVLAARPTPLPLERLRLRFPAVPASLPTLRHTLKRWLAAAGVAPAEAYEILVAAGEASSNAIEHAYGAADGTFAVETALEDGTVTVTVQDWGRWRDPRGAHRGRGLVLIRAFMDTVEVHRSGVGTTVRMQRRVRRGPAG